MSTLTLVLRHELSPESAKLLRELLLPAQQRAPGQKVPPDLARQLLDVLRGESPRPPKSNSKAKRLEALFEAASRQDKPSPLPTKSASASARGPHRPLAKLNKAFTRWQRPTITEKMLHEFHREKGVKAGYTFTQMVAILEGWGRIRKTKHGWYAPQPHTVLKDALEKGWTYRQITRNTGLSSTYIATKRREHGY